MNKSNYMTEKELQHIEHCNKVLEEHLDLVQKVTNTTEGILNTYIPILTGYVQSVGEIQQSYGKIIVEIIRHTRELKVIVSNCQEVIDYTRAAQKLNETLSDEVVQKIIKLTKE